MLPNFSSLSPRGYDVIDVIGCFGILHGCRLTRRRRSPANVGIDSSMTQACSLIAGAGKPKPLAGDLTN